MQTSSFHHMSVVGAFELLRAGNALNATGYTFKHDQHYDGSCTLVHLLCIDDSTGKAAWHAWRVIGSPWNTALIQRAVMNRMFATAELVSFGDILYYDPMHLVKLPHRHRAEALITTKSHTQPNGFIRSNVYGSQLGGGMPGNNLPMFPGPSDYPFMPGPGLPMNPQFGQQYPSHPQFQQPTHSVTSVANIPGMPNANRSALGLLNPHEAQFARETMGALVDHLNNNGIWNWNEDTDTDPKTEFTYKDGNFPRGVQRLIRKSLLRAAKTFGYKVIWSTPDLDTTVLTIFIDLTLEDN
jgi:hypothetical protein